MMTIAQQTILADAMNAIRGLGLPVCVFQPEDVQPDDMDDDAPVMSEEEKIDFLLRHASAIEERMCAAGFEAIETLSAMEA